MRDNIFQSRFMGKSVPPLLEAATAISRYSAVVEIQQVAEARNRPHHPGGPGGETLYDYDVSYRNIRVSHFPGGAAHPTYGIRMTLEYGYDEMHQKLYEKKLLGAGQFYVPADSFVYRYDSAHRLQRADKKSDLDPVPAGTRIDPYAYPSLFDDFTAYTLDGVNNRVLSNYDGIIDTGYGYDGATPEPADYQMNQISEIQVQTFGGENTTYEYDKNGNRTRAVFINFNRDFRYAYDFKNRLVLYTVLDNFHQIEIFQERYEYDALDHRIKRTRLIGPGSPSASSGPNGGLAAKKLAGAAGGHPLSGEWLAGELEAIQPPLPTAPVAEKLQAPAGCDDCDGKMDLGLRGGTPTGPYPVLYYYYDQWKLTELRGGDELNVAVYSHNWGVPGLPGGQLGAPYHVWGATDYANELGFHYALWEDEHGSSRALTFEHDFPAGVPEGTVEEFSNYEDFGQLLFQEAAGTVNPPSYGGLAEFADPFSWNLFQFNGQIQDFPSGLMYLRNRFYDPHVGQFITSDPVEDAANFGNRHTYCGNNPVNRIDPTGLTEYRKIQISAGGKGSGHSPVVQSIDEIIDHMLNAVDFYDNLPIVPECDKPICIEKLTLWSHGDDDSMNLQNTDDYKKMDYSESVNANMISSTNADFFASQLAALPWCQPCEIYLYVCNLGLGGTVAQAIANATGCTVYAPLNYVYVNYFGNIEIKDSDDPKNFPNKEGRENRMKKFTKEGSSK